jgi:hypothetical protein
MASTDPEIGPNEVTPLVKIPKEVDDDGIRLISVREEVMDTIVMGAPIFVSMVSWVGVRGAKD